MLPTNKIILCRGVSKLCVASRRLQSSLFKESLAQNEVGGKAWKISATVCIERLPKITPPLDTVQQKFKKHFDQLEFENSLKGDHELMHENDRYAPRKFIQIA